MTGEQPKNKKTFDSGTFEIYKYPMGIGRPPKPRELRRSKLILVRLTPGEWTVLKQASRKLGEPVAEILRKGAALYIHRRGKGGSRFEKEAKR
jgi:hypothetical protein